MSPAAKIPAMAKDKGARNSKEKKGALPLRYLVVILIIAVIIRMLLNFLPCYKIDMGGYRYWSDYLANKGFGNFPNFYRDVHCVYGPVYMYFLWATGKIVHLFSLQQAGNEFFVKIWAVLSDVIGGVLIYFIGRKYNKEKLGIAIGLLYIFNPAVFFNSSVWGQFDSFTATMLLAVVYLFNLKKSNAAVFMYAVAALTKPQSIALLPLVVILYFKAFPWKKYSQYIKDRDKAVLKSACLETLKKIGIPIAGCLVIYAVLVYPFYKEIPFYTLKEMQVYGGTDTGNLALNKSVTASDAEEATYTSYIPGNAVDDKGDTFWSSGHSDPQWIYVDLDGSYEISQVLLSWSWEFARGYQVKVSDDAKSWKTVYTEVKGDGQADKVSFSPVKTRYVRVECMKRPFPYGIFNVDKDSGFVRKAAYHFTDFYLWLVHQYTSSLNDYPYATANAFNLWMVLGKQTASDKEDFALGLNSSTWGYIFLLGISVFAVALLLIRKRSVLALYYAGYFLTLGTFVFGTKMHERYMLPAITFAMVCILWDKRMLIPTIILSACSLGNQWLVYRAGNTDSNSPWIMPNDSSGMFISWVTLLVAFASVAYIVWLTGRNKAAPAPVKAKQ